MKKGLFRRGIVIYFKIFEAIYDVSALYLEAIGTVICSASFLWKELANFSVSGVLLVDRSAFVELRRESGREKVVVQVPH